MKKNLGAVEALFPMPVLMIGTYDKDERVDVMNAAWGMISDEHQITLFLAKDRKTLANIKEKKAFTVAIADEAHMMEADFFGIASGNKMKDKFERTGLHQKKSEYVEAPVIEEFPVTMECNLEKFIEDNKGYFAVVGDIINTVADESVLDEKGKIDVIKVNAIMFDQNRHGYYTVKELVGRAWNAGVPLMEEKH